MTLKDALDRARVIGREGVRNTQNEAILDALESLVGEVDGFLAKASDYDEWERMDAKLDEAEQRHGYQPGFSVEKIHRLMGFEKGGY